MPQPTKVKDMFNRYLVSILFAGAIMVGAATVQFIHVITNL